MQYLGRRSLTRTLIEKEQTRQTYLRADKTCWYEIDDGKLSAENFIMKSTFLHLRYDEETEEFIDYSDNVSNSICLQLFYNVASMVLRVFMSRTCVNGFLNRGLMFLFSDANLESLLNSCGLLSNSEEIGSDQKSALDLGAGDGTITSKFRKFYPILYATEASKVMRKRLKEKNIVVFNDLDDWLTDLYHFHAIFCLNLIDRHPRPVTMLRNLHGKMLRDKSVLILAVVFPLYQYVEYPERDRNGNGNFPLERLDVPGRSFEEQAESFVRNVLEPLNFAVVRWTRLPYLCEGDFHQPFYVLDDAVFVLRAINPVCPANYTCL